MCGISGFLVYDGFTANSEALAKKFAKSLAHRGNEEYGLFKDDYAFLSNSRLSIIDLDGGTQPFVSNCGRFALVFNGEIYNYQELLTRVQECLPNFQSESDAEILVNYLAIGKLERAVQSLNGNFAIALYDIEAKDLYLIRDRTGQRPLHYTLTDRGFYFSSEVKSFMAVDEIDFRFDTREISNIVKYWSSSSGRTIWEGIHEVPRATIIKIEEDRKISRSMYWDLKSLLSRPKRKVEQKQYKDEFLKALNYRCISDVGFGIYLSGGLDSSAVCAGLKILGYSNLNSFSVSFEDKNLDESSFQESVASHFGLNHTSIHISQNDLTTHFQKSVWHCENVFFRTAPIPMLMLSQKVNELGIKVVLTGEGSDEFNYGYNVFKEQLLLDRWKQLSKEDRYKTLENLYPYILKDHPSKRKIMLSHIYGQYDNGKIINGHTLRLSKGNRAAKIFKTDERSFEEMKSYKGLENTVLFEVDTLLTGYLLSTQGDRVSLAHSVENRTPFLDPEFLNFVTQINPNQQFDLLDEKKLLKSAFKEELPKSILGRRKTPYRSADKDFVVSWINAYGEELLTTQIEKLSISESLDLNYIKQLIAKGLNPDILDESILNSLVALFSILELESIFIKRNLFGLSEEIIEWTKVLIPSNYK